MNDKTERRQHRRYKVNEDVFAVLGSRSEIMGRIQEMGEGGLSFTYRESNTKAIPTHITQPLSIISDGYDAAQKEPSKFNAKVISDTQTEENTVFSSSTLKRIGLQFDELTFYQKAWLVECIRKYALDIDEIDGAEKQE